MEAIFFAFISLIGWGLGDLFATITARKLNAYSSTFWSLILSILFFSLFIPFRLDDLQNLTTPIFLLNVFLGAILITGIIIFREALISGSSPLVVIISNANTAVTTILSIIFFKEMINIYQGLSIIVIFTGVFLSVLNLNLLRLGKLRIGKAEFLSLIAMLLWGIYFTFIKIPVREIGWFWPSYISFLFPIPFVLLFIKQKKIELHKLTHNNGFIFLISGVIVARVSELAFNLGISSGYTSIVAPIAGASPMLFVILAAIFLKDSLTKQQILGIVITLIGIILLSILSV